MDLRTPRYRAYCLAFVLAMGLATGSWAQRKVYTIQDCVDLALKNNVDARNSSLDVEASRLAYRNSFGQKIPTLGLTATQNFNAGYTVDPFTNQFINQNIRSNNFSLNSQLTLFAGNSINNTHFRLRSAQNAAGYSQKVTNNQITLEVAQYYTALLSAYKVEAATQARLEKVRKDRERILRRVEAKAAAKSDLADLDAQVATEELNLSRASGDITRQKLLLAQRMLLQSVDFDIAIPNVETLLAQPADTSIEAVYAAALDNLPDVKLARQNVLTNRFAEKVAKGSFYPTLTAGASVTTGYSSARTKLVAVNSGGGTLPDIAIRDTAGRIFTVPASILQNQTRTFNSVDYPFGEQFNDNINRGLFFQANIPILNRLTTKNNVDQARITRLRAQNEEDRTRQAIYNNVALAITEYKIARSNLQSAQRQLVSLRTALETARIRQDAGAGSAFDLLTQQQLFASFEANLVQTQFELVFRKLVIDFYMGRPVKL